MDDYVRLCTQDELEEGKAKKFELEDFELLLLKHNGKIHALDNYCPHHHVSIMHEGIIEKDFLLCPNHFWKFDIETGKKEGKTKGLDKYELKIIENDIYIKKPDEKIKW